ncbi:ABC transporter permease [Tenuibacillus multivorans]|uniref:Peptide/nickel transport system permease protein n=1 Tax=Tenuibacillus multivorans TaxID=237069 RepID=A0A1G9Y9H7_9BACI|nr:ABC transporter permease [Tenuibacillus multivorans]GEL76004.1 diguanylate cyclase [Tenuibacillus multivorans]SDN05762.1 peptide/nickel transport system permease protein [Tenuibacillus multivorans]
MSTEEKKQQSEEIDSNPVQFHEDPEEIQAISPWRDAFRQLRKSPLAITGTVIILFFLILGIIAPFITGYGYDEQFLKDRLTPPNSDYWLGTDDVGRDIFTRIAYGARISLAVGFFAIVGALIFGTFLGIVSGYFGKWIDMLISRIFDILLAFPSILLAIAVVAILGPSLQNALIAIAIINIPIFGRLVRSKVISLREEEYILAAKAQGLKNGRIIFNHILPNSLAPIIVQATLGFGTAILEAAALGFLGLGAQPPNPEWGKMLADSRDFIQLAPWTLIFPGISIMLVVLGFNLIGDGLRDALDPKMKN